jgi:putative transcriptional regulator
MKKPSRLRNRVRELRFFADEMTQGALAEKVGVTRQTIAAIEKNKYAPSLETAFLIAEAFDVPITEVFSYPPEGEE